MKVLQDEIVAKHSCYLSLNLLPNLSYSHSYIGTSLLTDC